ncbi:MAG TPA: hypothetical protein ENN43_01835, partial [bacterium]|nr:hypothetical protein [bacterium]
MKKSPVLFLLMVVMVFASCAKAPVPGPVAAPEDFLALLDYKQLPSGETYGSVLAVSNKYRGSLTLYYKGDTERIQITPGSMKEFSTPIKLVAGDVVEVRSASKTLIVPVKYTQPQRVAVGFAETTASVFGDSTVFYATRGKENYISVYHIANTAEASYGFPGKDTALFIVAFNNRITIKDTEGIIRIGPSRLEDRKIYYVTSYFYDKDYNYVGGKPG